jgi:signal transduction histidine kinase
VTVSEPARSNPVMLYLLAGLIAGAVLFFDLSVPLGVAAGVPYIALVLLGVWLPKTSHVIALAGIGTALTIFGYFMSEPGGIPWMVLANRAIAILAVWITATLIVLEKDASEALRISAIEAEQARMVAEAANRAKSEFLASMSHELRTPLNAVSGFAQLLRDYAEPPLRGDDRQGVEHILDACNQLLGLVNSVLDLSSIDAGKLELITTEIEADQLASECLAMMRPLANSRAITISNEIAADADLRVAADPGRLKQVLLNLLSNAVKYNRDGGTVTVSAQPGGDAMVRISVSDSGTGIAPERQAEVFQPFSRLGAEMGAIEGTGIGLSICLHLVELMDGRMGFESEQGVGSTFWFEVPAVVEPALSEA